MVYSFIRKVVIAHRSRDIPFLLYSRYSRFVGKVSTRLSVLLYGRRLRIAPAHDVWGVIRFMIHGEGSITIGKDFHAVSARRRSFLTLFSPCHLSVMGDGRILIGEHVGLNGTTIAARQRITIGDNTMIGPNTIIVDHDGHVAWPPEDRWIKSGPAADVVIGNDVWIGMNSMILKGVTVGAGSIIAAGSVVIRDVDPQSLYAGNPALKIKSLC